MWRQQTFHESPQRNQKGPEARLRRIPKSTCELDKSRQWPFLPFGLVGVACSTSLFRAAASAAGDFRIKNRSSKPAGFLHIFLGRRNRRNLLAFAFKNKTEMEARWRDLINGWVSGKIHRENTKQNDELHLHTCTFEGPADLRGSNDFVVKFQDFFSPIWTVLNQRCCRQVEPPYCDIFSMTFPWLEILFGAQQRHHCWRDQKLRHQRWAPVSWRLK